jgi:Flp pilus assembly protein TadD
MSQSFSHIDIVKYIRNNIVKVIGDKSFGTGFFIEKEYCVTCHHVIYKMNEINVEHSNNIYPAEWVKEYSDMGRDIAVLNVKGCNAKPLLCSRQALPQIDICGFGFLSDLIENIPQGTQFNGKLQFGGDMAYFPAENVTTSFKSNEWNKKPEVNVDSYQLNCNIAGSGISGSPVFYTVNWMVVGMFMANPKKTSNMGYVIPIETVLDKFKLGKEISDPSTTDMVDVLNEANEYFRKENYDLAINFYDKVIKDRNLAFAWGNKARSLSNLGRYNEAIECYDKAIEIDPNYVFALSGKGWALADSEKYNEAIECYDKAIEIDPNYVFALSGKGWALLNLGKPEEAIRYYDKALEINPNHTRAWNNKGWSVRKLGKPEEAIKYYDKALEINPYDVFALNNRANAMDDLGRTEEAIKYYDKALEINPSNQTIKKNRILASEKISKIKSDKDITLGNSNVARI